MQALRTRCLVFIITPNIEICATATGKAHKWNVCAIELNDDGNSTEPIPQGRLLLYARGTRGLILFVVRKNPPLPLKPYVQNFWTQVHGEKRAKRTRHKKPRKTMFQQPAATYIIFLFFYFFFRKMTYKILENKSCK